MTRQFIGNNKWETENTLINILKTDCAVKVSENFFLGSQNGLTASANLDLILLTNGANYYQVSGTDTIQLINNLELTGGTVIRLLLPAGIRISNAGGENNEYKGIYLAGNTDYITSTKVMLSLIYDSTDACFYELSRVEYA
jgi:hypothetical protein